jgi:hypothetical protein
MLCFPEQEGERARLVSLFLAHGDGALWVGPTER